MWLFFRRHRLVRLVVGGDLHLYADTVVCHGGDGRCIDQVITSGMTRQSSTLAAWHLVAFQAINQKLTSAVLADGTHSYTTKYNRGHLGNNFAVVQLPGTATVTDCAAVETGNAAAASKCWWRTDFDLDGVNGNGMV